MSSETTLATEFMTPSAAARSISSRYIGKKTNPSTITRWICRGVGLTNGGRLKLKAIRQPGGWLIKKAWVEEFFDVLTRDRTGESESPVMEARAERASKALAGQGF